MSSIEKRIFISRKQTTDSVFYKILTAEGFRVHGESLIDIRPVPFDMVPDVDWIFFYSKNGVRYFFEQEGHGHTTHDPATHGFSRGLLAAIGPATADYLEENFGHPHFVGNGNAETTAPLFLKKAKGKKVLFPRAKNSLRSVQQLLGKEVDCIDLIVYDNIPKKEIKLPDFDILVFTSPLNAKAYFSKKEINNKQLIIAIGNTTATALNKLGIKNIIIAENPSEQSLATSILTI